MANVLDYIDWRGDLSFEASPVNEIDKYIFACIGKPDYTDIIPGGNSPVSIGYAVGRFFEDHPDVDTLGVIASQYTLPALKKLAASPRYSGVRLSGFVNKIDVDVTEQFSAVVVHVGDTNYVSFRGTDDSIVGWKENCELAIVDTVPAQEDALNYLRWAAMTYGGPIVVCGHSKGGNLAIYAASMAPPEIQDRILEVYSYDGPGFQADFLESEGYKRIAGRVTTMVPQKSIVGMLLKQAGRLDVIQGEESGVVGHDGFTWSVGRSGFIHAPELSEMSTFFRTAINDTLADMDADERRQLVEEVFDVLTSNGAFTLTDLSEQNLRQLLGTANSFRKAGEFREFISRLASRSIRQAKSSIESRRDKKTVSST